MTPAPYAYPGNPHVRKHGPSGWSDYRKYRPWLRDEFTFRCVYCLERELWRDMRVAMPVDHFLPQARAPHLKKTYENLLYLCPNCNLLKGDSLLPDPCEVALGKCLKVHRNGHIAALNGHGELIVEVLELEDERIVAHRRRIIGTVLSHAATNPSELILWLGYPRDLPDLVAHPPPSNSKPEGAKNCYHALSTRGRLPECY
jgi:hypothetical protein